MVDQGPPSGMQATWRGYAPAQLIYWSNNVRGLNVPEKRFQLMRRLWSARTSVAFLQETHFRNRDAPKLENRRLPTAYCANHPEARKAGVAILFAHTTPFQCTATKADPNGQYLFLKGTIADHTYTFACLYNPNRKQHTFISWTLAKLGSFREGLLVVAGDLNLQLDPHLDTSRGHSAVPHTAYEQHSGLCTRQDWWIAGGRAIQKTGTTPITRMSTHITAV
ncbi:Hypothetical predicted protein [Pelobates cultripes]|uniref:Endonuclease/exonuclease/phosphatase domain-containing protein n=1 Tax=Pelobates cultripes TaxID=61616 RepID=A0AAD1SG32_PELCU|nr:Hypothetical predicted protein [Pelobates cultripes]